jgi:hypothetical protein
VVDDALERPRERGGVVAGQHTGSVHVDRPIQDLVVATDETNRRGISPNAVRGHRRERGGHVERRHLLDAERDRAHR